MLGVRKKSRDDNISGAGKQQKIAMLYLTPYPYNLLFF
jgi:hypothetical protein